MDPARPLIDKLGVRPGARVLVLGVADDAFWRALKARTANISQGHPRRSYDFIFLHGLKGRGLARLQALRQCLVPAGAIWVVWPRGLPDLKVPEVIAAAKAAGLVDTKVVRFSETDTALKLVIPVALRRTVRTRA
jgi:hypothetical protein